MKALAPTASYAEHNSLANSVPRWSGRYLSIALVACLGVLALAIRLHGLTRESLWLDEGYTLFFSQLSLPRLILVGGAHEHPPLYYLVVHGLVQIWNSYLVPRIVSSVAGSLSVPVLYALAARLYGRLAGVVAASLLVVSPFHLWYSQDGRGYELAGVLVLLSYLSLFSALDAARYRHWGLYVVCTVGCLYTDYTTALVLLPQVMLLQRARTEGKSRPLLGAWGLTALFFAPWIGTLASDVKTITAGYWIPAPTWGSLVNTVLQFLGMRTPCPSIPCSGMEVPVPLLQGHEGIVAGIAIAGILAAFGIAVLRHDLNLSVLFSWLVLPFALVLVLALRRSLYLDRVFVDATFPLYILLGLGMARGARRLRPGLLGALPVALVISSSIAGSVAVASTTTNPDWRPLARDLHAAYRPGEAVVFVPGVVGSMVTAYLPRGWHATREDWLWYRSYLDVPGWTRKYAGWTDVQLRDMQLRKVTTGERQVWLVTMDYTGTVQTRQWMADHGYYLLLSEMYSGDTRLELWARSVPKDFGPAVLPEQSFGIGWTAHGNVSGGPRTIGERGRASISRSFAVAGGTAYSVNVEWRSDPPADPEISIQTYDRSGQVVGTRRDRFGYVENSFPRTQWYSLPATGVWLSQPFGFVAPPGAVRATIRVANGWGNTSWRNIAVYRER